MSIQVEYGVIPEWTLGDRLRKAREMTGLDQARFAALIGVSRRGVSAAESGESKQPRKLLLKAWSHYTGVSLQWLETGEAPNPPGNDASNESPLRESNSRPFHYNVNGSRRYLTAIA